MEAEATRAALLRGVARVQAAVPDRPERRDLTVALRELADTLARVDGAELIEVVGRVREASEAVAGDADAPWIAELEGIGRLLDHLERLAAVRRPDPP